ncbi:hypothetical protein Clacol_001902 [Clathrus columnatus]|uniref:Uncharacterized protein n=1 Tax=Clathrus columnatus TaxID=1419009 RepID=A0AAV4ZZB2_9AGAM|nr:hypothetical protein Clacol_001902 [Clathrus columnatus]
MPVVFMPNAPSFGRTNNLCTNDAKMWLPEDLETLREILTAGVFELNEPDKSDVHPPQDIQVAQYFHLIHAASLGSTKLTLDSLARDTMMYLGYLSRPGNVAQIEPLSWPHAQVVANALGAYYKNLSDARKAALVEPGIEPDYVTTLKNGHFDMVLPAFSFIGSQPCFYLIPITSSFASAVARGEFPSHPTSVFYCEVQVPFPYLGMVLRNQRLVILKMFEAFKQFIPTNFRELCRFHSQFGGAIPQPINPTYTSNVWTRLQTFFQDIDQMCLA